MDIDDAVNVAIAMKKVWAEVRKEMRTEMIAITSQSYRYCQYYQSTCCLNLIYLLKT